MTPKTQNRLKMKMYKNLNDTYITYKLSSSNPIEKKDYTNICSLYHKFLIRKILEGYIVRLPAKMGTLCVTGKKQKNKKR